MDDSAFNGAEGPRNPSEILRLSESAEYLRMSRSHLLNILNGRLAGIPPVPYIRLGRRLLFRRTALDGWLRQIEGGD
jgi:excisionase family DNA binding protein